MRSFWLNLNLAIGVTVVALASPCFAKKTNQALYEDPFDIAAGGASLTRASKDGILLANPAQLPLGSKIIRWIGLTTSVLTNKESVETAQDLIATASGKGSSDEGTSDSSGAQAFIDKVFENPLRVGWGISFSILANNFGTTLFSRFEPDFQANEFGEYGMPEIHFTAESYHGAGVGLALRTPFRWLYLGATTKYIYASEPDLNVELTNQEKIKELSSPSLMQDLAGHNKGTGLDLGTLLFFQGSYVDYNLALKVDDVGNTALKGSGTSPTSFKQTAHAGVGVTLHTGADAIHFALDYRDIQGAYAEEQFKRIYAGTKVTLRTYLGVAAGFYQGYPTMGAEIDLILMRLALCSYTRELGDHPGVNPRRIYLASLSTGF